MNRPVRYLISPIIFAVLSCMVGLPSLAYSAQLEGVNVVAGEVTDNRNTSDSFSRCEVNIGVLGDPVADSFGIRSLEVTKAIDDTNRDLLVKKPDHFFRPFFQPNPEGRSKLDRKVNLRNPSRRASVITILEGKIELFYPTEKNGGKVIVRNFQERPGVPLAKKELEKMGIEIMYLTKEALEAKKKEASKKSAKEVGEEFGEAFADLFRGMFDNMFQQGSHNLSIAVNDPDDLLVHMELIDSNGEPVKSNGRVMHAKLRQFQFNSPPPKDIGLVVYVASPKAVKGIPFRLANIPLP